MDQTMRLPTALLRNALCCLAMAVTLVAPASGQATAPLVCSPGERACKGDTTAQCFSASRGETCTGGQVCRTGQSACLGQVGRGCYQPSRGETCSQGLVCQAGQSACVRGSEGRCYSPSRGETCH
jgi:hypothetical protein